MNVFSSCNLADRVTKNICQLSDNMAEIRMVYILNASIDSFHFIRLVGLYIQVSLVSSSLNDATGMSNIWALSCLWAPWMFYAVRINSRITHDPRPQMSEF